MACNGVKTLASVRGPVRSGRVLIRLSVGHTSWTWRATKHVRAFSLGFCRLDARVRRNHVADSHAQLPEPLRAGLGRRIHASPFSARRRPRRAQRAPPVSGRRPAGTGQLCFESLLSMVRASRSPPGYQFGYGSGFPRTLAERASDDPRMVPFELNRVRDMLALLGALALACACLAGWHAFDPRLSHWAAVGTGSSFSDYLRNLSGALSLAVFALSLGYPFRGTYLTPWAKWTEFAVANLLVTGAAYARSRGLASGQDSDLRRHLLGGLPVRTARWIARAADHADFMVRLAARGLASRRGPVVCGGIDHLRGCRRLAKTPAVMPEAILTHEALTRAWPLPAVTLDSAERTRADLEPRGGEALWLQVRGGSRKTRRPLCRWNARANFNGRAPPLAGHLAGAGSHMAQAARRVLAPSTRSGECSSQPRRRHRRCARTIRDLQRATASRSRP